VSHDAPTPPRRGGRPSREEAEQLGATIIAVATALFLSQGYGATSIDAIAAQARMSKRTFYARFRDKAALFEAVVHSIVSALRAPDAGNPQALAALFAGAGVEAVLLRIAKIALRAALDPQAIALQRIIFAEGSRFPELTAIAMGEGSRREAIGHIAALLERGGCVGPVPSLFAAEQFLQLVVSQPQRRAMGLGAPMSAAEVDDWIRQSVTLFLQGCAPRD
jgi:AcrR family transcriptional regulator